MGNNLCLYTGLCQAEKRNHLLFKFYFVIIPIIYKAAFYLIFINLFWGQECATFFNYLIVDWFLYCNASCKINHYIRNLRIHPTRFEEHEGNRIKESIQDNTINYTYSRIVFVTFSSISFFSPICFVFSLSFFPRFLTFLLRSICFLR